MPISTGELTIGDKVTDTFRTELYGETVGQVTMPMGPYRTMVLWPDDRGEQLEQNAHLVKVED